MGTDKAYGNNPAIPVSFVALACHPMGFDELSQGKSSLLAASPFLASGSAFLLTFWRVNTVKADTFAGYFNGVAVDNPGLAGNCVGRGGRGRHKGNQYSEGKPIKMLRQHGVTVHRAITKKNPSRGAGIIASYGSVRATRNPMLRLRKSGPTLLRLAERRAHGQWT